MNINQQIGAMVRECRKRTGLTQLELATKLGYTTPQFVSMYERGISRVPAKAIGQMSVIIGLPETKIIRMIMDAFRTELINDVTTGQEEADESEKT